jgi:hypothetical protein
MGGAGMELFRCGVARDARAGRAFTIISGGGAKRMAARCHFWHAPAALARGATPRVGNGSIVRR